MAFEMDWLDLKTIELDSLMEDGLWHDGTEATLIYEDENSRKYRLKD